MTATPLKPADRRTFVVNEEPFKVFMSFQRLNSLLRIVEDPTRVAMVTIDADMSEACMRALIGKKQEDQFKVDLEDYEVETDTYDEMITWCRDHLTHFFMKRLQGMVDQNEALGATVKGLQSSLVGSAASTSPAAAAGPLA